MARELARPEAEIRKLLKLTGRIGMVHEVAHDHFFLRSALTEIVEIVCNLAAERDKQFSVAQFRDTAGSGRKVAVHILEFLDRHGVTLRRGDLRRINKHRLDLFRRQDDNGPPTEAFGGASSPVGRPDFKSGFSRPASSQSIPHNP